MKRIDASPFGRQRERAFSTQAIDREEYLVPGELGTFEHHVIKGAPGRADDDFNELLINTGWARHRSPPSGSDEKRTHSGVQLECQAMFRELHSRK
jgi:hypothetical protein